MSDIELVQSLIDQVNGLPLRNKQKLDVLRRRAKMVIEQIFGDSSSYFRDLADISFFPMEYPSDEPTYIQTWLSGKSHMSNLFNKMMEELTSIRKEEEVGITIKSSTKLSNRVFIVHGQDEKMKEAVARMLEGIGLEGIILHKKANQGRTIIEEFVDYSDVSFAIVLLSPDDMAYEKQQSPNEAKFRARQNVIFELGFLIGKLGREHVLAIYDELKDFEMPSDYAGVLYIPYDNAGNWRFQIVKELKACGYNVDANKLL